ncbi:MAG: hypothetical protein AB7F59_10405 [Bdellovibrionales bacterium]
MKNQKLFALLLFLLCTAILQPWRTSFSQDDAVYARFVMDLAQGKWASHPLNWAGTWTQSLLGASLVGLLPQVSPLALLTFLTWSLFWILIVSVWRRTRFSIFLIASYFLFPVWVQYGASFLTDVYTACLIALLWVLTEQVLSSSRQNFFKYFVMILGIVLTGIQYQSFLALPFGWGLALLVAGKKRVGLTLVVGSLIGLAVYRFFPPSILQSEGIAWLIHHFTQDLSFQIMKASFTFLQLLLSIGLFLLPFVPWTSQTLKAARVLLPLHLFLLVLLLKVSPEILAVGVLFTGYLPPVVGAAIVSAGVWGLYPVWQLMRAYSFSQFALLYGTLFGVFVLSAFNAFRGVQDVRYSIVLSLPFVFCFARAARPSSLLGEKWFYLCPVLFVSLLTNLYNLETTSARWKLAESLEQEGISPYNISAGYGRDIFVFEPACIEKALQKAGADRGLLLERIMAQFPRVYEDGAKPQFLIKPKKVFGKEITLQKNLREGQDLPPVRVHSYSVFGLPNEVAVIDTGTNVPPWCLQ